jgi:cystathionine beta-lyase
MTKDIMRPRPKTSRLRPQSRGALLPDVTHASTYFAKNLDDFFEMKKVKPGDDLAYGVHGGNGYFEFADAITALEGGYGTRLCQTGLTAVVAPLLIFLSAGDHVLVVDNCYEPLRRFCDGMLRRLGITATYYDPQIGSGIRDLITPNTRMVYLESPGSLTFETQDVRAIAAVAADAGCWTAMDNTWASPLFFRPLEHGVDISIQAVTKYLGGHADLVMGAVTTNKTAWDKLRFGWRDLGASVAPDDVYLAHRGLATYALRMRHHYESGIKVGEWLAAQDVVDEIAHPALPDDPGHKLWRRDFSGAGGLFAFTLKPSVSNGDQLRAFIDPLESFGLGFSWAGPQSMLIPIDPASMRTATPWPKPGGSKGQMLRIFVGLDDPDVLIDELRSGFTRLATAS